MSVEYNNWKICDVCGHEGYCRDATQKEYSLYDADDVCQRCDGEYLRDNMINEMNALLIKIRDAGQWFHSALEMEHNVDGENLLKEIEAIVGVRTK